MWDLDTISKWASKWKITFSASKTKEILFSKKVLEGVQPPQFNNQIKPRVSSLRHLGLQLAFNLDWKEQVSIMCLKASRKLSLLREAMKKKASFFRTLSKKGGWGSTGIHKF